MLAQLNILIPVFLLIGVGYLLTKLGYFSDTAIDGLAKFTQKLALPCLLFGAISELDMMASISVSLILSFYIGAVVSFFLGYFLARALFDRSRPDAVAIAFCCLFSNTILLGLPITERAYGSDALDYNFAIIAFHAPICYLLGVTAMEVVGKESAPFSAKSVRVFRAVFSNPFVVAILLGCIVNVIDLPIPGAMMAAIDLISQTALPVALFGLGGILVGYRLEGDLKTVVMIGAISLLVHPAIVLGTAHGLALDQEALRPTVLTAAMAPGVNVYVFANMYGAARRVAAASVLAVTAASLFSVWLWISILA